MVIKSKSKRWTTIQVPKDDSTMDSLHRLCDLIADENEHGLRPFIYQALWVAVEEAIEKRTDDAT